MSARKPAKLTPAPPGDDALVVVDGEVITAPVRPTLRELVLVLPVAWSLAKVRESPFQHRTLYPALDKLTASLIEDGFLEPLLARPVPGHPDELELVSGHRRRRAGLAAGYAEGPFVIREMTDEQAIVAVGLHNLQREQPHPLEEALSYEMLAAPALGSSRPARTIAEIARMFGQDPRHVAQRLKLCALCDEGRALFFNDQIGVQVAFLIARMPHPDRQREVLAKMTEAAKHWSGPMSVAQVRELITKSMRALATVAFGLGDKTLPRWDGGPGDCLSCTRQTGAQAVLFEDVVEGMCLDAVCCTGKTEAHWVQVKTKAIENGERVLTPDEARAAFPHGHLDYRAEFIDLDSACHAALDEDDGEDDEPREPVKAPTYRALIGKQGAPVALAYLPESGRIVQLVARQDAVKALASAGHTEAAKEEKREAGERAPADADKRKRDEAKAREAALVERQVGDAVLVACLDKVTEKPSHAVMAHLACHVISTSWSDTQKAVVGRRGLLDTTGKKASDKQSAQELLIAYVGTLRGPALLQLIVEMTYTKAGGITPQYGKKEGPLVGLAGLLNINVAGIRAEVKSAAKASKKVAGKAKKSAPAKKAPAAKASEVEPDDEDEERAADEEDAFEAEMGDEPDDEEASAPALDHLGPLSDGPAVNACRLCGCTETTPCDDGAGDACSWANTEETLCTSCAYAMQAFEEQIDDRGAAASRAGLIELVEEQSDFAASNRVMEKALDAVLAAGTIVVIGDRLFSAKWVERIERLCSRGSKTTAQIRTAFKGIDRDVLDGMIEVLHGARRLLKDGAKWTTAPVEAATATATSEPARASVAALKLSDEDKIRLVCRENSTAEQIAEATGIPLAKLTGNKGLLVKLSQQGRFQTTIPCDGEARSYFNHLDPHFEHLLPFVPEDSPTLAAPVLPTTDKPAPTTQVTAEPASDATRAERVLLARLQLSSSGGRVLLVGANMVRFAGQVVNATRQAATVYVCDNRPAREYPDGVVDELDAPEGWRPDRVLILPMLLTWSTSDQVSSFVERFAALPAGTGRIVAVMTRDALYSKEVRAIVDANGGDHEAFTPDEEIAGRDIHLVAFYKNVLGAAPTPTASPAAKRAATRRKAKSTAGATS